jgi:hypothetical protein
MKNTKNSEKKKEADPAKPTLDGRRKTFEA